MTDLQPFPWSGRLLWPACSLLGRSAGWAVWGLSEVREAPLPAPPYVLASNHFSHLDPPILGALVGRPVQFLAVDELNDLNRFLDVSLRLFGAIPLPRGRVPLRAMRAALARLEAGGIVGLYPEGRRVARFGDEPPKRGAAWLAHRAGVPMVPVAMIGTDRAMGLDNRVHRARTRVIFGEAISPGNPVEMMAAWREWVAARLGRVSVR